MLKNSDRGLISPFIVMDVMKAANEYKAAGGSVIHMEVGQPQTGAPSKVLDLAKKAMDTEHLGYTDALGILVLRKRISNFYQQIYGIDINPERVVITTGASGGLILAFLGAFNNGDLVGITSPGYPAYKNILQALDIRSIEIPVGPKSSYQINTDLLDKVDTHIDGLIISSPANPTGSMISSVEMQNVARWCESQNVRLVSDEIYHGIVYDGNATTALEANDNSIIVNSFSKYFSMTGWRLGWLVAPTDMLRPIERLTQNLFISPPTLSQIAATAAFDCFEELDRNVSRYKRNREILIRGLNAMGLTEFAPVQGAFYVYVDVSHLTNDSTEFCKNLLLDTGVAVTPGTDFDQQRGSSFIRFCFAGGSDDVNEAVYRIHKWIV